MMRAKRRSMVGSMGARKVTFVFQKKKKEEEEEGLVNPRRSASVQHLPLEAKKKLVSLSIC
jgi:hypothetical protein